MFYFIFSILLFTILFIIYIIRTKNWLNIIFLFIFIGIITIVFLYSYKNLPYYSKGESVNKIFKDLILFASMLIGMITNTITYQIKKRKKVKVKLIDFIKPLFVAPIIFMVVWGAIEKMAEFNIITCCFSYTNGYFWETILKKVSKEI